VTSSGPDLTPRRRRSQHQLLSEIRARNGVTRSELSEITGLSRSAIAEIVQDLLADDLVAEQPGGPRPGRGRPSTVLLPRAPQGVVAGIDFGHRHVAVALADSNATVLSEHGEAVDVDLEAELALDTAASLVERCLDDAGLDASALLAVAAGIPGPIDFGTGLVRSPTILSTWVDLHPTRELSGRLGRPVVVGNDANMGALGELRFGAGRRYRDFVYLKASHGIGAALIIGGETYLGAAGLAGEIGHTQLPDGDRWCRCGNRGCLETVVSITELKRQLAHIQHGEPWEDSLANVSDDAIASRVVIQAGRTLGRVLADICNCLNPGAIVLGGELGIAGDPILVGVRESIERYAQPATAQAVDLRCAELGLRSELMGAVATAIQQLVEVP
jgi:predicted NBD/HSP70 family sugar kinase